ncbi:Asp23/Gls24 family envelope stress response protein [Pseudonocardia adelaidensis]|uniref:Alkaline shock family protein YloU n=1 Tax=Pseudonocardia adelaidensis TaxID=648754 RepID=A0ABP9NEV5_9PSEU
MSDTRGERLTCGRRVEDVLAQVTAGRGGDRDTHQRQCPHCQAALVEYERLWAPLTELAAEKPRAPDSVVENALRRIRGAVEHSDYGVLESARGRTRISARVVVAVARESAQAVPGVRVALGKHISGRTGDRSDVRDGTAGNPAGGAEVVAGVAGGSTAIEMTLAADYGTDLHRLGEHVRAAVTAEVRALTDLEPVQVTVIIDDILE